MIQSLTKWKDQLFGHGDAAITLPIFDGALKPNQLLQEATVVATFEAPEDIATDGESIYIADGMEVLRIDANGQLMQVVKTAGSITALACVAGGLAVCIEGTEIRFFGGRWDGVKISDPSFHAVNAMASDGLRLVVTDASSTRKSHQWRHDLMELGHTGRVLEIDLQTRATRLVKDRLRHAYGVGLADGAIWASESWAHQIIQIEGGVKDSAAILDRLPGYPSRLAPAAGGGFWLTVFTARTQLVEFVLREKQYRQEMVATIENPDLWISPQLRSWQSLQEPLQYPRVKRLGKVKPWAPPTSYGLVVRLDPLGTPLYSLHSRADGDHHGVVAAAELNGQLYVLSKGAKKLLRLDIANLEVSTSL